MGRPAGMGVRFLQLDPRSRRVLRRLVEDHFAHFGGPVESEGPSGPAGDSSAEPGRVPLVSQWDSHTDWAEFKQRKKRNRAFGWAALILAGLALVVAFSPRLLNTVGNRPDSVVEISPTTLRTDAVPNGATRAELLVEGANRPQAKRTSAVSIEQLDDSMSESSRAEPAELARQVVDRWSTAWSNQNAGEYLSHYASTFEPPDRLSRSAWEGTRRARIEGPLFIRVSIYEFEAREIAPDRLQAEFVQTYQSDRFTDIVRKTVELVLENGAWKIKKESSVADTG